VCKNIIGPLAHLTVNTVNASVRSDTSLAQWLWLRSTALSSTDGRGRRYAAAATGSAASA